jgi:hypothetical protein
MNQIEITIIPGAPQLIEGISQKTGREYRILKQAALVKWPNGIISALSIQPPRGQDAYKPGRYALAPDSFYPKDGALAFSCKLLPAGGEGTKS